MWFVDHLAVPLMAGVLLWEFFTLLCWLKLRHDLQPQPNPKTTMAINGLCWLAGLSLCYLIWVLLMQLPLQSDARVRPWVVILQFALLAGSFGALLASFAFKSARLLLRVRLSPPTSETSSVSGQSTMGKATN